MDKRKINCCILLVLLFLMIVVPVITVFLEAVYPDGHLDFTNAWQIISRSENVTTILNSLLLGTLVVLVSTLIAAPLAFLLVRTKFASWKWLDIVLMIPFMTPPYISSMGWILFVQKRGLFQQLFPFTGRISEKMLSLTGLVLVMSFHVFPFMLNILKNALMNLSGNLEESAAVCGAGPVSRLKKITMPLLTGNFAIGALLVFVKTLSEYGTPATLGKRIGFYVFTTDIHRYASTAPIDFGKAASLSSILVGICLVFWCLQNYVTARHTWNLVGGRNAYVKKNRNRLITIIGGAYIMLVLIITIGIPYFSVISTSFIKLRGYGLRAGNFTINHYIELFTANDKGVTALLTSAFLGASASTISALLGTMVVIAGGRKGKWKKRLELFGLLPEMLPNIVLVIGLMIFWNKIYRVIPLYNTIWFMVFTYVVMFLPYSIQYVSSAYMQMGDSLTEVARVCGAGKLYTYWKIVIPLLKKGIFAGWMMSFIIIFRELVGASLISPPNVLTVSTFIVKEFEQGSVQVGMAMAILCVLFSTTSLIALNTAINRKKG
ncbi:MAG: ABC transporter permease [Bacteroides sp.]